MVKHGLPSSPGALGPMWRMERPLRDTDAPKNSLRLVGTLKVSLKVSGSATYPLSLDRHVPGGHVVRLGRELRRPVGLDRHVPGKHVKHELRRAHALWEETK